MFEFGLLITAISWIIYLNKGSLSQGLITLSVLLFSYMLFSYGVIAGSIIEYFDWIKSIELLTFILFIVICLLSIAYSLLSSPLPLPFFYLSLLARHRSL